MTDRLIRNTPATYALATYTLATYTLATYSLIALIALTACSDAPITPTYHGGVRALIEAKCLECHQAGGIAPFALDDAETVRALAPSIVEAVETGVMPPFGQDPECREVADSQRLSAREIAAFTEWRDAGYPDGDPDSYEPPAPGDVVTTVTVESLLGPPEVVAIPTEPYLPDTQRPDDYRCIPLPYEFERDVFVNAVDVLPDQRELVHHVIVYAVPPAGVPQLEALDEADPGPGFNCFGDAGIEGTDAIGAWVPGSNNSGSRDVGIRVVAGSQIIVQMHYNIAGRDPASLTPDATGAAIWMLPEGQYPDYLVTGFFIANPYIDIAAGDPSSVHEVTVRLPIDGYAAAVSPHMHLLGKRIKTELIRPSGDVQCLTDVANWDFNWQRNYEFTEDAFLEVSIADRIRLTCEYDNSAANQPVINGEQLAPQDVTWGEGTRDEMCLESLSVVVPFRGQGTTGVCGGFRDCFDECGADEPFCALACMSSAGFSCLTCGTDGLLSECAAATCTAEADTLLSCMSACPEVENNLYGCLYDSCRGEFTDYYGCVAPTIADGSCASDFAGCEGIAP